ncbi:MAG TPA: acyl-CoA dehydrogenase family protein, partial [Microthrixaceae bacterium]|nr:acyl-CoA dehydrogenase family protein [Microthrixaceae bacterium]
MQRNNFSDEHHMFRDAFRTFLDREMVPNREKWTEDEIVDRSVFAKAGAAGFLAMAVPEEYGGAGVDDFRYSQIISEEICRADLLPHGLGMTLHNDVCLPYFLDYCTDEQMQRWLP